MEMDYGKMQFLRIHEIYIHSFKIILLWRKLLTKITVAFIFPLCLLPSFFGALFLTFLQKHLSMDPSMLANTEESLTLLIAALAQLKAADLAYLCLFLVAFVIVETINRLLSTAAVVYSTACFYSGSGVTFMKVMKVLPKVIKKLLLTLLTAYLVLFSYTFVVVFVILLVAFINSNLALTVIVILFLAIIFVVGLWYWLMVFQLSLVISVLEEVRGWKAMVKSRDLMKGRLSQAIGIWIIIGIVSFLILSVEGFFETDGKRGMVHWICVGAVDLLLVSVFFLLQNVVITLFYLVCKSYHGESVEKSVLSNHLRVYGWEYVPLRASDVQLEHLNV